MLVIHMLEVGRVCMKTAGREAGKYCVIVKAVDANHVLVTGPVEATSVKRRRCNIQHLEPLGEKINIVPDATDDSVLKAYEEADVYKRLGIDRPTAEKIREARERKAERLEKSKKFVEEKKEAHRPKEGKKKAATRQEAKTMQAKPEDARNDSSRQSENMIIE